MKLPCLFRTGHLGCGSYGGTEVEQEAPHSCGVCGNTVSSTRIMQARWYKCTDPSGWNEWGQICGPCLTTQWRSMIRSWDPNIHDDADCSRAQWKKGLFIKVIQKRLRSRPTGGVEEEVREPEAYELERPVDPHEWDDE